MRTLTNKEICYTRLLESGFFIIGIRLCIIDGNGLYIIEGKECPFPPPLFWFSVIFCSKYSDFVTDHL
jgi:hypothetical protein